MPILLHFLFKDNIVVDLSSVQSSSLSLVGSTSPGEEDTKIGSRSDCPTSSEEWKADPLRKVVSQRSLGLSSLILIDSLMIQVLTDGTIMTRHARVPYASLWFS